MSSAVTCSGRANSRRNEPERLSLISTPFSSELRSSERWPVVSGRPSVTSTDTSLSMSTPGSSRVITTSSPSRTASAAGTKVPAWPNAPNDRRNRLSKSLSNCRTSEPNGSHIDRTVRAISSTPFSNGKFPPLQEEFNNFAASYLDPIWESIHGVEGAGYLYGGMVPGFWNGGAHG